MWDHKLFEFFVTIIPQSLVIIFLFFTLSDVKVKNWIFLLYGLIYSLIIFLIRPYVNFGVHSVIMMLVLITFSVSIGKANVIAAIICSIITFIVSYLCEWITLFALKIFNFNLDLLNTDAALRAIIGFIPMLLLFGFSLIIYFIKKKKKIVKEEETHGV